MLLTCLFVCCVVRVCIYAVIVICFPVGLSFACFLVGVVCVFLVSCLCALCVYLFVCLLLSAVMCLLLVF